MTVNLYLTTAVAAACCLVSHIALAAVPQDTAPPAKVIITAKFVQIEDPRTNLSAPNYSVLPKPFVYHRITVEILSSSDAVVATIALPAHRPYSLSLSGVSPTTVEQSQTDVEAYTRDMHGHIVVRIKTDDIAEMNFTTDHVRVKSVAEEASDASITVSVTGEILHVQKDASGTTWSFQPTAKTNTNAGLNEILEPKWEKWDNPRLIP